MPSNGWRLTRISPRSLMYLNSSFSTTWTFKNNLLSLLWERIKRVQMNRNHSAPRARLASGNSSSSFDPQPLMKLRLRCLNFHPKRSLCLGQVLLNSKAITCHMHLLGCWMKIGEVQALACCQPHLGQAKLAENDLFLVCFIHPTDNSNTTEL